MTVAQGDRVPDVEVQTMGEEGPTTVSTGEVLGTGKVALFAVPGAFTPGCSKVHLPGYVQGADDLFGKGVDRIVCVSVNDPFVMEEWARDQECANVVLLPDGNGEFTAGMDMLVDKSDLGFGKRSWRYSMLVRDGVIEKMFVEPQKPGDPFEVSDADTMLAYLNPKAKKPDQVAIFTREGCQYCARAKTLLNELGYEYAEVPLPHTTRSKVVGALAGAKTVPQVFINGKLIGGLEQLETWAQKAA